MGMRARSRPAAGMRVRMRVLNPARAPARRSVAQAKRRSNSGAAAVVYVRRSSRWIASLWDSPSHTTGERRITCSFSNPWQAAPWRPSSLGCLDWLIHSDSAYGEPLSTRVCLTYIFALHPRARRLHNPLPSFLPLPAQPALASRAGLDPVAHRYTLYACMHIQPYPITAADTPGPPPL